MFEMDEIKVGKKVFRVNQAIDEKFLRWLEDEDK